MPRLIDITCPIKVWGDQDRRVSRYIPDPDVIETLSAYEHVIVRDVVVPLATANEAQNLQDIAAVRGLYIEMDRDFDLFLNGAVTPLEFRRLDDVSTNEDEKVRAFLQCAVSSIGIGNPNTTDALDGFLVLWGDVAA